MQFSNGLRIFFAAAVATLVMYAGTLRAEGTVFYSNIFPSVITPGPVYSTTGSSEWADDVPFAGSHVVSAFTIGYKSYFETDPPFKATFRFYGVDPQTSYPGALIAEITRELPAGEHPIVTIQLDPSEQFVFTSEPGLYPGTASGGWFSVQFEAIGTDKFPTGLAARQARGTSARGIYSFASEQIIATFDPDGFLPASWYLELFEGGSSTVATDLSVTIDDSPRPVNVNEPLTYTLVVTSIGADATGVTLTDTLPADITFESVTTTQGTCTPDTVVTTRGKKTTITTTGVSCVLGNLADGASATVEIVIKPNAAGTITNSASVDMTEDDLSLSNNSVSRLTLVQDPDGGGKPCRGKKCK